MCHRPTLWGNAVFAVMHKEKGNLSHEEWKTYLRILGSKTSLDADCVVYLDCDPSTSFERIKVRGRQSESSVSLEYLQDLERHYATAMLLHLQEKTANVVPIQWDNFGTARQVLDTVLKHTERLTSAFPIVTGDATRVFVKDRPFRAQCVATLVRGEALCLNEKTAERADLGANAIPEIVAALS